MRPEKLVSSKSVHTRRRPLIHIHGELKWGAGSEGGEGTYLLRSVEVCSVPLGLVFQSLKIEISAFLTEKGPTSSVGLSIDLNVWY